MLHSIRHQLGLQVIRQPPSPMSPSIPGEREFWSIGNQMLISEITRLISAHNFLARNNHTTPPNHREPGNTMLLCCPQVENQKCLVGITNDSHTIYLWKVPWQLHISFWHMFSHKLESTLFYSVSYSLLKGVWCKIVKCFTFPYTCHCFISALSCLPAPQRLAEFYFKILVYVLNEWVGCHAFHFLKVILCYALEFLSSRIKSRWKRMSFMFHVAFTPS